MNRWLVQMPVEEIVELSVGGRDDFWPEVDRKGQQPPALGDEVVLWQMGPGDTAGAMGLGVFDGQDDIHRPRNYAESLTPKQMRPCMRIEFTHWFADAPVRRTELRRDPRFANFSMFRFAARANPWRLSDDQWDAIVERLPRWAPVDYRRHRYLVELRLASSEVDAPRAIAAARNQIVEANLPDFGLHISRADKATGDRYDHCAQDPERAEEAAGWVTWSVEVSARTAAEAYDELILVTRKKSPPTPADLRYEGASLRGPSWWPLSGRAYHRIRRDAQAAAERRDATR